MELTTVWFILIAVLWIGYFTLEGFDFGVGMLLPVLARDDRERRLMINTIGPVWDGNEVWLLTAGGATFAAFPEWYATLFSGFYLPLLLILLALIVRGLAFEYRHQRPEAAWHSWWDRAIIIGSFVPAFLWGVAFANIVRGVPIDETKDFTGHDLHPAQPVRAARRAGDPLPLPHPRRDVPRAEDRRRHPRTGPGRWRSSSAWRPPSSRWSSWSGRRSTPATAGPRCLFVVAALALVGGIATAYAGREGWGFIGTFVCIGLAVAGLFVALFPDVMPSSTDPAFSLTTTNAAATHYTLTVMTFVAAIFTPLVLCYQAWTYWIFRKRISVHHIPDARARGRSLMGTA